MKKLIPIILTVLILISAATANAALYSGAWRPDGNIVNLSIISSFNDSSLYIYDFDNGPSAHPDNDLLVLADGLFSDNTVYFSLQTGSYYASLTSGGTDLYLGNSRDFGFYFLPPGPEPLPMRPKHTFYDLVKTGSDTYQLYREFDEGSMEVAVDGAAPVPEPSTLLLFGAGMIGLGFLRKRQ